MQTIIRIAIALSLLFSCYSTFSAEKTVTGNGSVMLSVWQEGITEGNGFTASVIIDTGLNFSDLITLDNGKSLVIDVDAIFNISTFLQTYVVTATNKPVMNIVSGSRKSELSQLFSSSRTLIDSAINVELRNSLNSVDRLLETIPESNFITSTDMFTFPNAGHYDQFNKNFGKAFMDIDNAFEFHSTSDISYDGVANGKIILLKTSSQGSLNGLPLQIDTFDEKFTFNFNLSTGELKITNLNETAN